VKPFSDRLGGEHQVLTFTHGPPAGHVPIFRFFVVLAAASG
jgi:hypothetical protein